MIITGGFDIGLDQQTCNASTGHSICQQLHNASSPFLPDTSSPKPDQQRSLAMTNQPFPYTISCNYCGRFRHRPQPAMPALHRSIPTIDTTGTSAPRLRLSIQTNSTGLGNCRMHIVQTSNSLFRTLRLKYYGRFTIGFEQQQRNACSGHLN